MSEKLFHNIWITGNPNSIYKKICLDGIELKGVRSCMVCYDVDEVPRVFLEIQTPDIEVEDFDIPVLITRKEKKNVRKKRPRQKAGRQTAGTAPEALDGQDADTEGKGSDYPGTDGAVD